MYSIFFWSQNFPAVSDSPQTPTLLFCEWSVVLWYSVGRWNGLYMEEQQSVKTVGRQQEVDISTQEVVGRYRKQAS